MSDYQRYDPLTDAGSLGFDPTGPGPLSEAPPPTQITPPRAPSVPPVPPALTVAPAPQLSPVTPTAPAERQIQPAPLSPPRPPRTPSRPDRRAAREAARRLDRALRSSPRPTADLTKTTSLARRFRRLWIPGVLVLAGILAFISGVTSLVATVNSVADGPVLRNGRAQQVFLRTDEERTLWVDSEGPIPRCRVTGPPGGRIPRLGTSSSSVETGGVSYRVLYTITARSTGNHQVLCTGGSARLVEGSGGGGILRGVLTLLGGVFAFVLGIILLVGRLFGWNAARRRSGLPANRRGQAWGF